MGVLKIPRITTTDRLTITPAVGELIYDTDLDQIFQGDGTTVSGVPLGGGGGHVIKSNGTPLTQRAGLNFSANFTVTDDSGNDETDVEINTSIIATKAYVDGGANTTNAASRLYLFNSY